MLAAPITLFLRLCTPDLTPECSLYLSGFFAAMVAKGDACYPEAQADGMLRIDMEAIRKMAIETRRETLVTEAKSIHSAISKLYPCKEK